MKNIWISSALFAICLALIFSAAGRVQAQGEPVGANGTKTAIATFAGGCFWCMEPPFDGLDGVVSTTSGYTGGEKKSPTYIEVSGGSTGHAEAVRIEYDPEQVTYEELLEVYWVNVDPLTLNRQFCDPGNQYRTAIFFHDAAQQAAALASRTAIAESGRFDQPVVTEVVAASAFYPAEAYHQDYYQHNPIRYKAYRWNCGRDKRLKQLWGEAGGGHHG